MSEQTMKNRIVVEKDPKGCAKCFVHSSTVETKTNTNLEQKKGLIYVKQNRLKESVPVGIVFKVNFIWSLHIMFHIPPMDAFLFSDFKFLGKEVLPLTEGFKFQV